jgi:curved DNA-binding protein CbpA
VSENYFELFGLVPRPFIDENSLKQSYLRLSAEKHPDKFQGDKRKAAESEFALINRAYQALRDPKERLVYLFELVERRKPISIQDIPQDAADLFMEISQISKLIDQLIVQVNEASTAVEKVTLLPKKLEYLNKLQVLQNKISEQKAKLDEELKDLDEQWIAGNQDVSLLEELYRKFSYIARWGQQLDSRAMNLAI